MARPDRPSRVWTGLDALVQVFVVDKDNDRIDFFQTGDADAPAVNYCYFQNCSLNSEMPYVRRPITGRPSKRILRDTDEWELSVEHLYLSWAYEFDPLQLFDRSNRLELNLTLQKLEDQEDIEEIQLIPAFRVSCNLAAAENGLFIGSAKFAGEQLFRGR
jgi:hypothetical protein